ncbi:MAG: adenylosuccinate synthase [Clostridia bacterium]|nr:adenylosuccinate synthase [Clostridia bacterium]
MIRAIVGANWGDEGKGKLTDMFAAESDIVIRFQGGSNAGHTIINNFGKFALHQLPSGVFYKHITNVISNGVALNVDNFKKELDSLKEKNIYPNIIVSDRACIVMPYHILLDVYEEERLGKAQFGSTKSGIAPFYSDKFSKIGFQVSELYDTEENLKAKVSHIVKLKNLLIEHIYNKPALDEDEIFNKLIEYREILRPYVRDTVSFIHNSCKEGKNILLEGQLGSLKDTDFGIYPMVTSSNTIAGYACAGAGIPPYCIEKITAVVKAYSSAVGAGEFVSEIFGKEADELRNHGGDKGEYGATTGRARRMGWLDLVASKYGCEVQGATEIAFTVIDALGYLDKIPVCVGYEIDGKITDKFPPTVQLKKAKPVLEVLDGWKCDIKGIKNYDDLPLNCRKYIEFAEKFINIPITMISNGPRREDIIFRNK